MERAGPQRGAARSRGDGRPRPMCAPLQETCTSAQPALHRAQLQGSRRANLLHGLGFGAGPRTRAGMRAGLCTPRPGVVMMALTRVEIGSRIGNVRAHNPA